MVPKRFAGSAMRVPPAITACAAGVLLGTFYTLSPMTVWFGLAMIALFVCAGRGLERRERVWIFGLLASALTFRLLALVIFFFVTYQVDGSFPIMIPDEEHIAMRSRLLRYIALDIPLAGADYAMAVNQYGDSGLYFPLAYLQLQFGDAPYAIRLLHVALYMTGCVTLYRTVRPTFGAVAALGGLAVVLFLPSLFVWSIASLKEAPHQFLTAISVGAAFTVVRARSIPTRVLGIAIGVAALLALGRLRFAGDIMVGGGIVGGLALGAAIRRPVLLLIALVLSMALGAAAMQSSSVRQRATNLIVDVANFHVGHVHTTGWHYKILDPEFYIRRQDGSAQEILADRITPAAVARYLIRAGTSFVLVPLPWNIASRPALAYMPEQVVWYLLVALAPLGAIAGVRRDPALTLSLLGIIVLGAGIIGVTSGNVGTLIRHRAMVLMALPWLSGLGACELVRYFVPSRGTSQHEAGTGLQEWETRAAY